MRYLLIFCGTLAAIIVAWFAAFFAACGSYVPRGELWLGELLARKHEIAARIESPKILIVSGSSALFGFSAEQLEVELGIPAVNYGTHQGLSLEFQLYNATRHLQPGDTVVLPLQYQTYLQNRDLTQRTVDYCMNFDAQFMRQLSWPVIKSILGTRVECLADGIAARLTGARPPRVRHSVYSAEHLSSRGDLLSNTPENRDPEAHRRFAKMLPETRVTQIVADTALLRMFEGTIRQWQRRGIRVIGTYSTTLYFREYRRPEYLAGFAELRRFYEKAGAEFVGSPFDFMHDQSMFFDSRHHPTAAGRRLNTLRLATHLRPLLEMEPAVQTVVGELPDVGRDLAMQHDKEAE